MPERRIDEFSLIANSGDEFVVMKNGERRWRRSIGLNQKGTVTIRVEIEMPTPMERIEQAKKEELK